MSVWKRVLFVLAAAAPVAATARANIPTPELSEVPDRLTLATGATFAKPGGEGTFAGNPIGFFTVHVAGPVGAVNGSFVEVEIAPDVDELVAWCQGQQHPILSGFTDANGDITFEFHGGGCIIKGAFPHATFIAQVKADGVVLKEPDISSPDAVNSQGKLPTTAPRGNNCENGMTAVGLSDAVFHTRPIKLGLKEPCTKFAPPWNASVGVLDAVYVTPFIKQGNTCVCQ